MQLRKLQTAMLESIFHPFQGEVKPQHYISETAVFSAEQQLDIYRGSIISGISGALDNTYPVCRQLTGGDFFDAMAHEYIVNTPSLHPDLNIYGRTLAEFIDNFEPANELPYLSDIARLEWLLAEVFSAADERLGNLDELAYLSEQDLQKVIFQLPLASRLLQSDFPIEAVWSMHQGAEINYDEEINLDQGGVKLIVWRDGLDMKVEILDEHQWSFLVHIQQQHNFSSICESMINDFPGVDMGHELARVIQAGWVSFFRSA